VKSVAFNPNGWKIEKIGRAAGSLWCFAVFWVRLKSNRNISTEPLALCCCEPLAVSSFPSKSHRDDRYRCSGFQSIAGESLKSIAGVGLKSIAGEGWIAIQL
jgi:hypothetical protein